MLLISYECPIKLTSLKWLTVMMPLLETRERLDRETRERVKRETKERLERD